MDGTHPQRPPKVKLPWRDKLGFCCHRRQDSIESIYHPEWVAQALADLGPPTRSSLHISPQEGDNEVDMDRLVPTSIRKSISYPDFRADSIILSDSESPESSLERGRTSIQRLHSGLMKRLSRGSSVAGSFESPGGSRHGHQVNMSQESINRRKELKRALHRRVTEALLEEKTVSSETATSESDQSIVDSAEAENQIDKTHTVGSLRSRKSSKSLKSGLATVAEVEDGKKLGLAQDDHTSPRRTSWLTMFPSSDWVTRTSSLVRMSTDTPPRPPSEPLPVFPEVFMRLKKVCRTSPTDGNTGKSMGQRERRLGNSHIKRLSITTNEAIREVFRPLDTSPQRLGLWLQGSKSSVGIRSFRSAQSHSQPIGSATESDEDYQEAISSTEERYQILPRLRTFDGPAETIELDNVRAKNNFRFEPKQDAKATHTVDAAPLTTFRRLVNTVVDFPFGQRKREEDKDKCVQPATSLPSLRSFCADKEQQQATVPTASTQNHQAASVNTDARNLLWDENSFPTSTSGNLPSTSRGRCDPFINTCAGVGDKETSPLPGNVQKRSRHQHSSSLQSSTASFRAREIAAVSKRIVVAKKNKSLRKSSRFKEVLDDEDRPGIDVCPPLPAKLPWRARLTPGLGGLDGADDLQPPQKPLSRSYSMADFMQSQDDAGGVWERALQEHAFDVAHKTNEARRGSMIFGRPTLSKSHRVSFNRKGKEPMRYDAEHAGPSKTRDDDLSPGASPKESPTSSPRPSLADSRRVLPGSMLSNISTTEHSERDITIPAGRILGNADTPDSWTRFASHTREERNGPAGAQDCVNAYDFAGDDWDGPAESHEARHNNTANFQLFQQNQLEPMPTSPVGRLPIGVLQILSKFSKSAELELAVRRSAHRGIRSSISAGGEVSAPELELLGLTTRAFHPDDAIMRAPENSDLDRPIPPSPLFRGTGETDQLGRQLAPPIDWGFPGRRKSSTGRRPSMGRPRSNSMLAAVNTSSSREVDLEAATRPAGKSDLLSPPAAEDIPLPQKPRAAKLASSVVSSGQSDEDLMLGRRSSRSRSDMLSDHELEMKQLYTRTRTSELRRPQGARLSNQDSDPRNMSSGFSSEGSAAGPSEPLLGVSRRV